MSNLERNMAARESILRSIREHLVASAPHDVVHAEKGDEQSELTLDIGHPNGDRLSASVGVQNDGARSLIEVFGANLEAVGGHCIVARSEAEVIEALNGIIASLQDSPLRGRTIALSNAPLLERLMARVETRVDEIAVSPSAAELFDYDVGISTAQAAIAETGTLMIDSEAERHRLVSLVPPAHIAIVDAANIRLTLGETLATASQGPELSPTITFITGPSRTADIELTLAIGVHGPQELYVVVNEGPPLTNS
ncbi:MAG: lactate utilization protein [Pyrinomonadaceae bacterium]|nr:lactate utilization protein [Pyrinomonadaceae bacterium]